MANDFKCGNKNIASMYFGNTGVASLYFGDKLIWQKQSNKKLVSGTEDVYVEFRDDNNDTYVNYISIFTTDNYNYTNVNVKIVHESGAVVGYADTDTKGELETKYELEGWKRTAQFNNLLLKKGYTYYIGYTVQNQNSLRDAYFQSINGNYKVYHSTSTNPTIIDISNCNDYKGILTSMTAFLQASYNDFLIWNGSSFENNLTVGGLYVKANKDLTGKTIYASDDGTLGQQNSHALDDNDKITILNMSSNTVFLWLGQSNLGMSNFHVYNKIYNTTWSNTEDFNESNTARKMASLLLKLKTNGTYVKCNDNIWGTYQDSLKNAVTIRKDSRCTIEFTDATSFLTSFPENPTTNGIYLVSQYNNEGVWIYKDSTWHEINQYNWKGNNGDTETEYYLSYYVTRWTATDVIEDLGSFTSDFIQSTTSSLSTGVRNATLETTKKFYLEINGVER